MSPDTGPEEVTGKKKRGGPGRPKKGMERGNEVLLEAALSCFAESGFDKTSLREIALRANIDVALISYRYGSKHGIWVAAVEAVARESVEQVEQFACDAGALPEEKRLSFFWENMIDMIFRRPQFAQMLLNELVAGANNERTAVIAEVLARPLLARMQAFTQIRATEREGDEPIDSGLAFYASVAMIGTVVSTGRFLGQITPLANDPARLRNDLVRTVVRLFTPTGSASR